MADPGRPMDDDDELDARMVGERFCDVPLVGAGVVLPEAVVEARAVDFASGLEAVKGEPVPRGVLAPAPGLEDDGLDTAGGHIYRRYKKSSSPVTDTDLACTRMNSRTTLVLGLFS